MVGFLSRGSTALLLCAAAATGYAIPLGDASAPVSVLETRHSDGLTADNLTDYDSICGHKIPLRPTPGEQDDIWWQTTSGLSLDIAIKTQGYDNWVRKLDQFVFDKNQSPEWDCASVDGSCDGLADCKIYFDKGLPQYYWIMLQVTKAHQVFRYINNGLINNTIIDLLNVEDMVSQFGQVNSVNIAGVAGGAFGIASGLAGAGGIPGLGQFGGAIGAISGAFGVAAANFAPADPTAALKEMMSDYYTSTSSALVELSRNLFGEGDPKKLPAVALSGGNTWDTEIANFFEGGMYILESVSASYEAIVNTASETLRKGLIMRIIKEQKYSVFIDTDKDEGSCSDGGHKAQFWHRNACWSLRAEIKETMDGAFVEWELPHLADKIVENMDKWGVFLPDVYDGSIDCMKNRGGDDRDVDVKNIPYDGNVPLCFYNLNVIRGSFDKRSGNIDTGSLDDVEG